MNSVGHWRDTTVAPRRLSCQEQSPVICVSLCIEHVIHIATKHFVEAVAPTPPKPLNKKIRQLLDEACNNGELDATDVAKVLSTLDDGESAPESEWTAGDAVGKVLALIKQIRMSPQARTFFKKCCVQVGVRELELLLWVRTRWASLYKSLDRVLELRKAIDQFVRNADASDEVPDLRNKEYSGYMLSRPEWDKIVIIHEALREPADVTQTFSRERTPTVWRIIPTLEFLIQRWETMTTQPRFAEIEEALSEGVESLKKWFHRTETSSDAYFICLVLDPNIKDVYFKERWTDEQYKKGIKGLEKAFDKYHADAALEALQEPQTASMEVNTVQNTAQPAPLQRYGGSFLLDAVNSAQKARLAHAKPCDELKSYLSTPLENTDNILHYWGHNTTRLTLRRMARDYLAIQGSATPAEQAFSSSSLTDTKLRNRLNAELFGALQLLKSAYRNGHMSAGELAAKHMDALIAELDADFGYNLESDTDLTEN